LASGGVTGCSLFKRLSVAIQQVDFSVQAANLQEMMVNVTAQGEIFIISLSSYLVRCYDLFLGRVGAYWQKKADPHLSTPFNGK
jgi:hypothetical protein